MRPSLSIPPGEVPKMIIHLLIENSLLGAIFYFAIQGEVWKAFIVMTPDITETDVGLASG